MRYPVLDKNKPFLGPLRAGLAIKKNVHVPGEGMGLKSASDNKLATDILFLVPSPSSVVILTSSFLFTVFTFLPKDV